MDELFEWDPSKATRNFEKHSVAFEEATTVFGDPFAITIFDPKHSHSENRMITTGYSSLDRQLSVAHTDRGDKIRIISARQATPAERKNYERDRRR